MKLKYLFPSLVAATIMLISCSDDNDPTYLSSARVSSSYVTISPDGGSKKITITSSEDWTFDYEVEFETDSLDAEKGKVECVTSASQLSLKNDNEDNTWINVSPRSGGAGSTEITFSADPTGDDRESTLKIKIGDEYQTIIVSQKAPVTELPLSTVKDVINGVDSKTYRVSGSCSAIANTTYGNWYMTDDEGNSLYIYGTVDASGSYNWSSFNIEIGDIVTVEGARTTYGSTIEIVDASFVKVEKALLQSKELTKTIEMTNAPFTVTITQKGNDLSFYTNSDWLKFAPTGYTVDKNGNFVFTIHPEANTTGKNRVDTLYFESANAKSSTRLPVLITQLSVEVEKNVSIFDLSQKLTASTDSKNPISFYVELKDAKVTYKSGSNFFIEDGTGGLCIYNSSLKLKVGDIVTGNVWGSGYTYNGLPEATVFNYELAKVTTDDTDITPAKVTLSELAANYDKYISRYVCIEGVSVAQAIDVNYKQVVSAGSVTDGTNTIVFNHQSSGTYKKKNLSDDEGKDNGSKMYYYFQAAAGDKINVTCVPSVYKETKQLNIYQEDWLKK